MLALSIPTLVSLVLALVTPVASAIPVADPDSFALSTNATTMGNSDHLEKRGPYCPGLDAPVGIIIRGVKDVRATAISGVIDQCGDYWHIAHGNKPKAPVEFDIFDQGQRTRVSALLYRVPRPHRTPEY